MVTRKHKKRCSVPKFPVFFRYYYCDDTTTKQITSNNNNDYDYDDVDDDDDDDDEDDDDDDDDNRLDCRLPAVSQSMRIAKKCANPARIFVVPLLINVPAGNIRRQ